MKLRTIILVLTMLVFLSTTAGGFLYYSALHTAAVERVETQARWHTKSIINHLDQQFENNQRAIRGLSGHAEMRLALGESSKAAIDKANQILTNFNKAFEADVSYLMDREGNTIASSNHDQPDSFVGKNYLFRPYYTRAVRGTPTTYMAVGVTSGKRGIYFSHAVYSDEQDNVIGVVVMKAPVDVFESELLRMSYSSGDMLTLVADLNGLIFMSCKDEYVLQFLERVSQEKISAIAATRQFGGSVPGWSGFDIRSESLMIDAAGNNYIYFRDTIPALSDWQVIHLHNKRLIREEIYTPLRQRIGTIAFVLCAFTGLSALIFYKMAHGELIRRQSAENALKESEERYRSLVESSSDQIFVINRQGVFTSSNRQVARRGLLKGTSLVGRHVGDVFEPATANLYMAMLEKVLETGKSLVFEYDVSKADEKRHLLDTLFPIKRSDETWSVGGISRDITDQKQGEKEREALIADLQSSLQRIRTLSGMLPICAHCKNIRDDQGYWNSIEAYITEHSEATLSHGICQNCAKKYYPDLDIYGDDER